jgi:hypothetical protein
MEDKPSPTLLGIGDLCFEFEYAFWMAKDEQPGAADGQGITEFGANASIADISAGSTESLPVRNKINVKAGFHPAASIFEFADTIHVARFFGFFRFLGNTNVPTKQVFLSIGCKLPGFQFDAESGSFWPKQVVAPGEPG